MNLRITTKNETISNFLKLKDGRVYNYCFVESTKFV